MLLALGVAAPGCIPAPVDVTGKRCGPDQACGPGFQCLEGRCSAGGATPRPTNLVPNSGFEEGAQGWETAGVLSTEAPGFSGTVAARLVAREDGAPVTLAPRVPPLLDSAEGYYCASAWVRGGEGRTAVLRLLVDSVPDETVELPLDGSWKQVTASTLFFAHSVGSVQLVLPAEVGTPVWVDDVRLWRSDDDSLCEVEP
ncbi:hypothetical protein ACLESD_29190 [Pyxidicoccus sp. 3LFB2]